MNCQFCKSVCKKDGKQKDGTQKYRCKTCLKYQQEEYKYLAKLRYKKELIPRMIVNNSGFRGIARILDISVDTVTKTVMKEAGKVKEPSIPQFGIFEVDEMQAYRKKGKDIWATYAIERKSNLVIGITTGKRNTPTIRKTINSILITNPRKIYTDGYSVYKKLISEPIHKVSKKMLCKIERLHLTARNGLKMLNRKTLSFVRKPETLLACLKLLF